MGYSDELKKAINRGTYLKGVRERALDTGDEGLRQWADSELRQPYDYIREASRDDYELLRNNPYSELLKHNERVQAEPTYDNSQAPRVEMPNPYKLSDEAGRVNLPARQIYDDPRGNGGFYNKNAKPMVEMPNPYKKYGSIGNKGLPVRPVYGTSRGDHGTFSEEWLRNHPAPVSEMPSPYGSDEKGRVQLTSWLDRAARFLEPVSRAQIETGGGLGVVIPPELLGKNQPEPGNPVNAEQVYDKSTGDINEGAGWVILPSKVRTAGFALRHPIAANRIGYSDPGKGKTDITNNTVRFSTNHLGLNENEDSEGSQVNAFRHALWQATITKEFGPQIALEAGYAHEDNPYADLNKRFFSSLPEADQTVDLLNNIIGRQIGENIQSNDMKEIAMATLKYYAEHGLYVAQERIDGGDGYVIARQYLSYPQYKAASDRLSQLDSNGYAPNHKK